jgi:SAM-dependent methyltransferase
MPSSDHRQIPKIIDIIKEVKPKTVLDIAFGFGKYGLLIKEYLRPKPYIQGWQSVERVDGLEVFEDYVTPIQRAIYDKVIIANAVDHEYESYDLYLMVDCIEHMSKEDGTKLVEKLRKLGKVLVVTPRRFEVHPPRYGNPLEEHISVWSEDDFPIHKSYSTSDSIIVLI